MGRLSIRFGWVIHNGLREGFLVALHQDALEVGEFALENSALVPALLVGLTRSHEFENEEGAVDDGKVFGGRGVIDESTEGAGEGQLFIEQEKGFRLARSRDGRRRESGRRRPGRKAGNGTRMGGEQQAGARAGGIGQDRGCLSMFVHRFKGRGEFGLDR